MSVCGKISYDAKTGYFEGEYNSLAMSLTFRGNGINGTAEGKPPINEDKPSHRVEALSAGGKAVDIGAAWTKTIDKGPKKGQRYLSLRFDDPSFQAPINLSAFDDGVKPGSMDLIWSRPKA